MFKELSLFSVYLFAYFLALVNSVLNLLLTKILFWLALKAYHGSVMIVASNEVLKLLYNPDPCAFRTVKEELNAIY